MASSIAMFEVRPSTGNDTNGGGFAFSNTAYKITNLISSNGTSTAPIVTTTTYSFTTGDSWLYIAASGNWSLGLYQITGTSGGTATLAGPIGTTATLTSGTCAVDYSQQASPVATSSTVTMTNGSATVTATGSPFTPAMCGNLMCVSGGTGTLAPSWYQIISWTNANVITVDRTFTLGTSTGCTANVGGALQTINAITGTGGIISGGVGSLSGNKIFIKSEATITTSTGFVISGNVNPPSVGTPWNRLIGYTSTRNDGGKVTFQGTTPTITVLKTNIAGWSFENLIVDGNNQAGIVGADLSASYQLQIFNCLIKNCTSYGVKIGASGGTFSIYNCEFFNNSGTAAITSATSGLIQRCNIHDNTCVAIQSVAGNISIFNNLITNCTGATSDGIQNTTGGYILNNTFFNCGRYGYNLTGNNVVSVLIKNNIFANNASAGIAETNAAGTAAALLFDGNAYYNNAGTTTYSSQRFQFDDISTNKVNAISPYTNVLDINCTVSPFTRATTPVTDLTIDGTLNTKVTSSGYSFVSSDIGETIYITNQTGGWTAGTYTISTISGTAAVLSTSPGTTASTGGTWYFNDFTLNNVAGGGNSIRGYGTPGALPGVSQTGKIDMGVFQHTYP